MALRRHALLAAATVLVATGCAYYNGLYNARQLAGEARRAEREGRPGEARSLWSRAATKAESVAVRFPESKWRDDALLLQGQALLRIDACTRAVEPLRLAADSSPDRAIRNHARIDLGRCRIVMREPAAAALALSEVLQDGDSVAIDRALYWRGQAWLDLGRPAEAVEDLERTSHPDAAFPRALALTRLDREAEASETLTARLGLAYLEQGWLSTLDTIGRKHPDVAGALVDQLIAGQDLTTGQRARLLVHDGERWMAAGDTAAATERFQAARDAARDSVEGRVARAWLGVLGVRAARSLAAVDSLHEELRSAVQRGGRPVQIAGRVTGILGRADSLLDHPAPDELSLFVTAEQLRDSVLAVPLAGRLFTEIATRFPESVIAPKALLAAAQLRLPGSDSLVDIVQTRYAGSVYARALTGDAGERYQAVEDSLRALLAPRRGRTP